jgi:hypothetical protein
MRKKPWLVRFPGFRTDTQRNQHQPSISSKHGAAGGGCAIFKNEEEINHQRKAKDTQWKSNGVNRRKGFLFLAGTVFNFWFCTPTYFTFLINNKVSEMRRASIIRQMNEYRPDDGGSTHL